MPWPTDADASKLIRLKHTKDFHENLANVREVMNVANAEFEATAEQYRLLARKSINQADLRRYVKKVLKVEDESKLSTRMKNIIEEILGRCESGKGNDLPSVRGTYWTAYNGVNEWLAYQRGHSQQNRLNSLWFGDSAPTSTASLWKRRWRWRSETQGTGAVVDGQPRCRSPRKTNAKQTKSTGWAMKTKYLQHVITFGGERHDSW